MFSGFLKSINQNNLSVRDIPPVQFMDSPFAAFDFIPDSFFPRSVGRKDDGERIWRSFSALCGSNGKVISPFVLVHDVCIR
jgi:hypothetical protein